MGVKDNVMEAKSRYDCAAKAACCIKNTDSQRVWVLGVGEFGL